MLIKLGREQLGKERWIIQMRMKYNGRGAAIECYGLSVSDAELEEWRTKKNLQQDDISDKKARATIIKRRVADLIGTAGVRKSLFFIYKGTVS